MAINYINTGSSANKGDGDTLRTAFTKINNNFSYLNQSTGVQANADLSAEVFLNNTNHTGIYVSYNTGTSEASLTLFPATTSTVGGVKAGNNVTIEPDGTISAGLGAPATTSTVGGVIVGYNLNVDSSGTLTANNLGNFVVNDTTLSTLNSSTISMVAGSGFDFATSAGNIRFASGLREITFNPLTNTLSLPSNSTILSGSNDTFNLKNVSQIQFADGTSQSSAYQTVGVSTLTNGSYIATLGNTGTFTVPANLELASYSYQVFANPVMNTSTVVISAGFGTTPQAGWKFNGYTVVSVTPGTGNYSLELLTILTQDGGTYPLQPVPGFGGSIMFPDGTAQSTAYQIVSPPATSTSTGIAGSVAYNESYFYACTATNAWQRVSWDSTTW